MCKTKFSIKELNVSEKFFSSREVVCLNRERHDFEGEWFCVDCHDTNGRRNIRRGELLISDQNPMMPYLI